MRGGGGSGTGTGVRGTAPVDLKDATTRTRVSHVHVPGTCTGGMRGACPRSAEYALASVVLPNHHPRQLGRAVLLW